MRLFLTAMPFTSVASSAFAGAGEIPMPGAGIAGPAALLAAVAAVVGVKYLKDHRRK